MRRSGLWLGLILAVTAAGSGSVVGRSVAAPSLTEARVQAELPPPEQGPWLDYLRRSSAQMLRDKAALAAERRGLRELPPLPHEGSSARAVLTERDATFYRSAEGRRLADAIVSFQTPAGGWSKNLAFDQTRQRGQSWTTNNLSKHLGSDDFDAPNNPDWNYVGTLDNDATNTELRYLALMSGALPGHSGDRYRRSFLRGVEYLLHAQYPNGGWPQVWPLEGGYHDAITYNDDAVTESATTLGEVALGARYPVVAVPTPRPQLPITPPRLERTYADYSFVPAALRRRARAAADRALECILRTQVRIEGRLTVWPQQSDPLTLQPVAGRNFEPAALSAGESASVLAYLIWQPEPSPAVRAAIEDAAAWFEAHRLMGYTWTGGRATPGGRHLAAVAGAGPLWPRYVSLTTDKPIFGDRDKSIHDDVMDLSLERRNGYAWYTSGPAEVLLRVSSWRTRWSVPPPSSSVGYSDDGLQARGSGL